MNKKVRKSGLRRNGVDGERERGTDDNPASPCFSFPEPGVILSVFFTT